MSDTLKSWSIEKITRLISNLLKKNQGTANAGKFMKVGNDGNLVPDTVPDPTNKADKVTNATTGNFAGLDATGNLTDSGKSAEDFAGAIYKTATPGSIVTIDDGADDLPIKELKVAIEPVQDLHGYDHPWPAGGGVNLFDIDNISSLGGAYGLTTSIDGDVVRISGTYTGSGSSSYRIIYHNQPLIEDARFAVFRLDTNSTRMSLRYASTSDNAIVMELRDVTPSTDIDVRFRFVMYTGTTIPTAYSPYSNICPISGWTGAKVTRTGANLYSRENGEYNVPVYGSDGSTASYADVNVVWLKVKPNTTYHVSLVASQQLFYFRWINCDANRKFISRQMINSNTQMLDFTTTAETEWVEIAVNQYDENNLSKNDWQICISETATAYEPYQGETYDITFPSEAGTVYGGTLDVTTGELVVDRIAPTFDGTFNDIFSSNSYVSPAESDPSTESAFCLRVKSGYEHITGDSLTSINPNGFSSRLKNAPFMSINNRSEVGFSLQGNWKVAFLFYTPGLKTKAEWLSWFANNPTQICYKLATPQTYQLTPQEIRTLLGVNNIWADTGDITELIYPVNTDTAMALYEKADKVVNATAGNFASLDANGNLTDSGKKPSDFLTQHQDISGKADKVSGATNGNFAGLDSNGNLTDSGKSADDFLDKNYEFGWKPKTLSGLANIDALYVWTDGENIYYSKYGSHYVLDKTTFEWTRKVWNGYTDFSGKCIWSDGENIYYSSGGTTIVLDKSTSTWSIKYWNNFTYSLDGDYIWTDGENYYYSMGTAQYVLDKANDTWVTKTWNGLTNFDGVLVWTDGNDIYHTAGTTYVLDKATSTWSVKTWSGMAGFGGSGVWSDGENIYYNSTKVLDRDSSTWEDKSWNGLDEFYSENLWTDGENIYCSRNSSNYILDNKPKLYLGQDGEFSPVPVKKFIDENVPSMSQIVDLIYPVGSIYMSVTSTSPATLFGGTWQQLKDRFLIGTGDTYSNGATGGAASVSYTPAGTNSGGAVSNHTLTVDEIPSHNHSFTGSAVDTGNQSAGHTHNFTDYYATTTGNTAITTAQMPSHSHGISAWSNEVGIVNYQFHNTPNNTGYYYGMVQSTGSAGSGHNHSHSGANTSTTRTTTGISADHTHSVTASGTIGNKGGGKAHNHGFTQPTFTGTKATINTMPPYLVVYMWKRTA